MIPIFHICWVFGFEIAAFINNKIRCEILYPIRDHLHRNIYIFLTYSLQVTFFSMKNFTQYTSDAIY